MGESDSPLKSDVFERTQADGAVVSAETYNTVIGLVLCWGLVVNWVIVRAVDPGRLQGIPPMLFMLGYFASCFYGVYLFNSSKDPAVSFLGYNFVVIPFGLVLNIVLSRYDPRLISEAIQVTGLVTAIMMFLGSVSPQFFEGIHTSLTVALMAMILVEFVQIYVLGIARPWTDWVVTAIFCGYIGYDWGRANRIPKTLDNAVDSAAAIYMDIVNLFLRILSLLARKRR